MCLGSPYCRRVEGNYAEALDLLPGVVSRLHAAGKRAYVSTPAVPREADLPHVGRLIDAAAAAGADALEIHNLGVLRIVREKGRPVKAHMGAYANVYTHLAAGVMRDAGAVRVRPNAEVSLEEMAILAREAGVEVEVLVHGKIPLGVTDRCFLLTEPEETDPKCPSACGEVHWLTSRHWVLKTVGKGVLSGRDMCLLEHLPRLVADGFRVFRVEGLLRNRSVPVGDRRRLPGGAGPGLRRRCVHARGAVDRRREAPRPPGPVQRILLRDGGPNVRRNGFTGR